MEERNSFKTKLSKMWTVWFYIWNRFIFNNRVILFWFVFIGALVSFFAYIFLPFRDFLIGGIKISEILFSLWAVFSLLVGSVVFMQLQGEKKVQTIKDLMETLIHIIENTKKKKTVYIITPNLSIGQTQVPNSFKNYLDAIKKAASSGVKIKFCVWGLKDKLLKFNLNEDFKSIHVLDRHNNVIETDRDNLYHIHYVYELITKQKVDDNKKFSQLREYNKLIEELMKYDNISFYQVNALKNKNNHFFLVCNKTKMYISSVKANYVSADIIDERGFLHAIMPRIIDIYFDDKNLCTN